MIRHHFTTLLTAFTLISLAPAEEIKLRPTMPRDHTPRGTWWAIYQDERLDALMREATKANFDIKTAALRFEQSRAVAQLARSAFFPTAGVSPAVNHQSTSGNTTVPFDPAGRIFSGNTFSIPLDVSYEIDLWGRVRMGHRAALADSASTAATAQQIALAVQAEVAQNYFGLRAVDAEIHHLEAAIALLTATEKIASSKQQAGTITESEVARAKGEVSAQQAVLVNVKARRDTLQNAIAVLCARRPSAFSIASRGDVSLKPPALPSDVPSDLLERRPDIAASERALEASIARLGVAKKAGYPSLSIGGTAGFTSGSLSTLFASGSENWVIGPVLNLPIFSGGQNKANLEIQKAATEIALANYQQTILLSFAEVENQLTALRHLSAQLAWQTDAGKQADKARDATKSRYQSGAGSYLESLDAQRNSLEIQRLVEQTKGQQLIASVTLIKAIGGGWNQKMSDVPAVVIDNKNPAPQVLAQKKPGFFARLFGR
jgi:multidrug efflux system outer membrane protein